MNGPAYKIVTSRTITRCYNPSDAALLKASIDESIEHLRGFMAWAWDEPTDIQAKADLLRRFRGNFDLGIEFVYGIFNLDETRLLGGTGLHTRLGPSALEIGYWINTNCTNQGLATETSAALTKVAFEIEGVERVEIHCDAENAPSAAVPKKLGYTLEVTRRKILPTRSGGYRDMMIWTLLKEEYPASPAAKAEIEAYDCIGKRIL